MRILDVQVTTEDGLESKTARLRDGTVINWCHPCRRWEWDCSTCGHVNGTSTRTCRNCGEPRVQS